MKKSVSRVEFLCALFSTVIFVINEHSNLWKWNVVEQRATVSSNDTHETHWFWMKLPWNQILLKIKTSKKTGKKLFCANNIHSSEMHYNYTINLIISVSIVGLPHLIVSSEHDKFTSGQKSRKREKNVLIFWIDTLLWREEKKTFLRSQYTTNNNMRSAVDRSLKLNTVYFFSFLRSFRGGVSKIHILL